ELARRIANGNVPPSLGGKSVSALDLPVLRVLEKDGPWYEKMDRALLAAAEDGAIFFVNRMHDRPVGMMPVVSIYVTEILQRPIMAGKIQCIGTSTPASFAKLQRDGHWLSGYFSRIEVAPASEEMAIKVLQGIKTDYERFHNISYTDEAITLAVLWAGKYVKAGSLPGAAVEVIDQAGAAAQLRQAPLPAEVIE